MAENNEVVNATEVVEVEEPNGTVSFTNEVISTIVGLATVDIEGVAGMSGGIGDGFTELVGRKNYSKGVKVEVGKDDVTIDMRIIVKYGFSIPEICRNIQQSVTKSVETMTGLKVKKLNIAVQGIVVENDQTTQQIPAGEDK